MCGVLAFVTGHILFQGILVSEQMKEHLLQGTTWTSPDMLILHILAESSVCVKG